MEEYENKILKLTEKEEVKGLIYVITNTLTKKCYIGQTRTHILNKNKYRPFGIIGRLNGHFSEAITNTKQKNQSTYLNNSIRKYGKEVFVVELIETCRIESLDDKEAYYIKKNDTLYPNGYNLRAGNHEFSKIIIKNNAEFKIPTKRGREFGFKHNDTTINKMKKYYETADADALNKKSSIMQNSIIEHFSKKRAETLANSDIIFDDNFADLIRPRRNKNGEIVSYVIRYKRKKYCNIENKKLTPDEIYKMLYDNVKNAYEIQKSRTNEVKITEMNSKE
jgi:hypothetical protein